MAPKFGTSGLRGLVVDLTPDLVGAHVRAFLAACDTGGTILLGRDLRPSSPAIAAMVTEAARAAGTDVVDCGALATPALALAAADRDAGAVMVTGSHIPADRNGLKFYSRQGEITKTEEQAISAGLDRVPDPHPPGGLVHDATAGLRFVARITGAWGKEALAGRRIGLYAHSAVGADMLATVLRGLGATVVVLGRSERFVAVDTEAVDPGTRDRIAAWTREHRLDALVSTDGDSDRPLLADETGRIVPGDIMGQIAAEALGAEVVVTPLSSNGGVMRKGFARVVRTRIGSPHVIAGMAAETGRVVGYEANGGFLLGFTAAGPAGPVPPLMTRDCVLPLVATLIAAAGGPLSARIAAEPPVVTLADRLQDVPPERGAALVDGLAADAAARAAFLSGLGDSEAALDLTDGLRMTLESGRIVHLRPSGNAPEFRLYVEAEGHDAARRLLESGMLLLARSLSGPESGAPG